MSVADVRNRLADLINRVAYRGERILISRHGRAMAAVVPIEDLQAMDELRRFVARRDVARALADARKDAHSQKRRPQE